MTDDLGFEEDPKPATEQKAASKLKLSWLDQEKFIDAAKKNKLKTGAGLVFVVLFLVWLIFSASPPPPAPAARAADDPRVTPVSAEQMRAYSTELQRKIQEQIQQLKALKAQQDNAGTADTQDSTAELNPDQRARLNRLQGRSGDAQFDSTDRAGTHSRYESSDYGSSNEAQRIEAALHSGNLVVQQEPSPQQPPLQNTLERASDQDAPRMPAEPDKASQPRQEAKKPDPNAYAAYTGKLYRLPEDTVLEAATVNKLNNSFSGPVIAQITTDVWNHDGQQLLIPAGTKVFGEVKRVQGLNDQRLALSFHRMLMPDLYPVRLDQFQGLNQIGETGLRDQVNHHYIQIFGTSIALGAIAGLSQIGTNYGGYGGISGIDQYRAGVTQSLSESSMQILNRFTNILPTFTIREGQRIRIILTGDLALPAYQNHRLPADL